MENEEASFKVVMLGSSGVGKTAIVERITKEQFNGVHVPTVGAQYISLPMKVDEHVVRIELWDTAGQEVFRSLVGFYSRDAKGVFLVADVTNDMTIEDLSKWTKFIKENTTDAEVILFGNKTDLIEKRNVKSKSLHEYAEKNGYAFYEGSAKTGQNVFDAFSLLSQNLFKKYKETNEPEKEDSVDLMKVEKKKSSCC